MDNVRTDKPTEGIEIVELDDRLDLAIDPLFFTPADNGTVGTCGDNCGHGCHNVGCHGDNCGNNCC